MKFFPEYDYLVSWKMLGAYLLAYGVGLVAVRSTAGSREPYRMKSFMMVYNSVQILLCGWMTHGFVKAAFSWSNPFALNVPYTAGIEYFMMVHFASKILDFTDTFIMLFKKNFHQFTFLHVYHHVTILMVWGFLLQSGDANGTAYFGAMLNSGVHFLMYSHYLVTSFGIRNPLKPLLTNLQLVQFGLCLVHAVAVVLYEQVLPSRLAYLQLAYHTVMLILFGDFKRKQIRELRKQKQQDNKKRSKKD